ncbi:qcr9 subunit 9 of the ubiquinol cytochrome-c reductase complex [Turnera subulata]|uniref:Complex III subunit 9 n=1 Tax=Turnera subulata TaxID=218843 RepID=A0A9Q0J4I6_9ROSI|nr:qcr9 subunit 9 of the ubiquinol cytochrome-c reductase complex [Turnera subulata]
MDLAARRNRGGGLFEGLYRVFMRRSSVYVTFVIAGAFAGERAVDYGVRKLWESNNVGLSAHPVQLYASSTTFGHDEIRSHGLSFY